MSTKLYTGIKFKSNKLGEVIRQLHSLKEEAVKRVQKTFEDQDSPNFIRMCIFYMILEKEGKKFENYFHFERELKRKMREPYSDIGFDFKFSVVIYERKNKLYGTYFDHTYKNYQKLFDEGIAVDYHYQDQCDKPDEVSWRDWNFRKKVWEDIFDDISCLWIPREAGVTYDIVTEDDIRLNKEIFEKVKNKCKELKEKKNEDSN